MDNDRIKVPGYARRIFFNDNIEYRNFSPDLVGFQLTSNGGTTLFTNGNFTISVNLDPKPNVLFKQGTKSKFYTLNDVTDSTEQTIEKNQKLRLNIDLTNPLSYIWYGSAKEYIRASLLQLQENFPAAIYVDTKVGSVTGNNITDFTYDISADESVFTVNSKYFVNPYNIKYTVDSQFVATNDTTNPLRNFTVNYTSFVIEHNGIKKNVKSISAATQTTNSDLVITVEGNPFPELTGIFIPELSFLQSDLTGSIPYLIKPNEEEIEKFFSGLDDLQRNILNRDIFPQYTFEYITTKFTDDGVILTSKELLTFPILEDGYNLNFFDTFYIEYLDNLTIIGEDLDESSTDIILRKYTTEAISSFDTIPRGDGEDLTLNGEKATKLLRIYGVEFDEVKKYINGIKFAHVVTYDKKNNVPDALVKDLAYMLGLDKFNFVENINFNKLFLPTEGEGSFSGSPKSMSQSEVDIELYRRLILNLAWTWKSKGSRKAIEFLFRFIGAPESLVNFDEYIVMVDKPLNLEEIKKLLYLYTGEVNLDNIPYDENGFPLPPINGELVVTDFINPETGELVVNGTTEMYFQKGGGWYRETYGSDVVTNLMGNNPHIGPYDAGGEYLNYFSRCYVPNFDSTPTVTVSSDTIYQNYFINYNYGIFNGIPNNSDIYTTQLTFNSNTGNYQPIDGCIDVNYNIIETPLQNDGKTTYQQQYELAEKAYNEFLDKIKVDSYLQYSPEWQVIKSNFEVAKYNVNNEVVTEGGGINKTLEICLNELEPNNIEYSCDNLEVVECSPFIYYKNSDSIKVSFDEFPTCCVNSGGRYVNYVNEYGRSTEYCSKLAPCIGDPVQILDNGVVVFEYKNNTVPNNVYTIFGQCFQLTTNGESYLEQQELTAEEYIKGLDPNNLPINFYEYFNEVDCIVKSSVSSPECCAWHGYDFTIIEEGKNNFIVCTQKVMDVGDTVVTIGIDDVDGLTLEPTPMLTTPYINFDLNNSFYSLQNPIGAVYQYYSTEIFTDCFNESVLIKNVVGNTTVPYNPNSVLEDPTLMNPENWEVSSIDEYGRVSFTPKVFDNNFILDWYSDTLLSDLYKNVADYYGYEFGTFTFDYNNNVLIPFTGDNPLTINPNSTIIAAVDPTRIGCDEFNNVSVVFASEKWQGFTLPEVNDCECKIDFSFDYMLKYETDNLISCAMKQTCFPAFFYDNSLDNINCLDFVAFTTNEDDSQNIQNSFNDLDNKQDEYVIWQNTNVIEPNVECCNSIGGNVVLLNDWLTSDTSSKSITKGFFKQFKDIDFTNGTLSAVDDFSVLNSLNFNYGDMIQYVESYKQIKEEIEILTDKCFAFDFTIQPCDIDYTQYIRTESVCSLDVPLECGFWSSILSDYYGLKNGLENLISQYQSLCSDFDTFTNDLTVYEDNIKTTTEINSLNEQKVEQLNIIENEQKQLRVLLDDLQNQIEQKSSDNITIQKASNQIDNQLDCSIYELKIKEINNFDYNGYCNSNILPTGNKLTDSELYNNCVKTKTLENEELKKTYNQLLTECNNVNTLNEQLVNAKFDNNSVLVNELEKEIVESETKINELTNDVTNDINSNEALLKSDLEKNDNINTINRTAELLNTTTDNITDSEGNLVLTDSQKVQLSIIFVRNQTQINELRVEQEENQSLFNTNIENSKQITSGSNNEGEILFSQLQDQGGSTLPPDPTGIVGCTLTGVITAINNNITIGQLQILSLPADISCATYFSEPWVVTGMLSNGQQIYRRGCCEGVLLNDTNTGGGTTSTGTDGTTTIGIGEGPTGTDGNTSTNTGGVTTVPNGTAPDLSTCCVSKKLEKIEKALNDVDVRIVEIEQYTRTCYDNWSKTVLYPNFTTFEEENDKNYLDYIDDLKINFKLFVDNNDIDVQNNIDTSLTYLPYTQSINPIWSFNPTSGYTGIFIEGEEQQVALIEDAIFTQLSEQNIPFTPELFTKNWETFKFSLPDCVCDDLRRLYPNKQFYFSIEIDNYECSVCLLVDNININITDCNNNTEVSLNDCFIPQLSCVKDNKKSWVYTDGGIIKKTIFPDGECNTGSTISFETVKLQNPKERLWTDLEYRYTDYDVYHSDLIINVKNTTFSIDPAKAIECDVFDFWKNIDCDNCDKNCSGDNYIYQSSEDFIFMDSEDYLFMDQSSLLPIKFSGDVVYTSTTPDSYVLDFDDVVTSGLTFSCSTYTDILESQVIKLKNNYYTLTSDYTESISASYYDLLEKGGSLPKFFIQQSNCVGDILVINNNQELDNLFGLLVEESDGTIGFYETYIYTGTSIYTGGTLQGVISGVTAQTFNQGSSIDKTCCESLNKFINSGGVDGLGLGKNYQWDSDLELCSWRSLKSDSSDNDCQYCGTVSGCTEEEIICVKPLDFLDVLPSEISIKEVFDTIVVSNLIDVKSRQTISDYPLLRLFYQLYLNANGCGKDLTGRFTYDNMFEFMDKIGDYWLDLIEEVVPSTTIWDGCDNSGKVYRNTIFDQNKYKYRKYNINFIDVDSDCPLSAYTDYSVGSQTIHSLVEQAPIYPTSNEIQKLKNELRGLEVQVLLTQRQIDELDGRICALQLQDFDVVGNELIIGGLENQKSSLLSVLQKTNDKISTKTQELEDLESNLLKSNQVYMNNYMSCSGITETLTKAQEDLVKYTPNTTEYERQRNYISSLKNEYNKCIRKSNTLISDYNTVFITQKYDSNEYEGNVTILGDSDWEEGGPFYNKELIHNC